MIERALSKKLLAMTRRFPVITLTGPRQSGKTTLVRWLFPNYEYINLENLNDMHAVQEDPIRFLKTYSSTGVIINEAQKFPELFSYLQGIVDESKKMGKFILTGSYPVLYDRYIQPQDYYPSYIQTYIERDVRSKKILTTLVPFRGLSNYVPGGQDN